MIIPNDFKPITNLLNAINEPVYDARFAYKPNKKGYNKIVINAANEENQTYFWITTTNDSLSLANIVIETKGLGVGTEIINLLEDVCIRKGIENLTIDDVMSDNMKHIAEKQGFILNENKKNNIFPCYIKKINQKIKNNLITYGFLTGVNVRDELNFNYAKLICDGSKTIETRNSNSLKPYINKRVRIIRTGIKNSKAMVVGECTIGAPIIYKDTKSFSADYIISILFQRTVIWIVNLF